MLKKFFLVLLLACAIGCTKHRPAPEQGPANTIVARLIAVGKYDIIVDDMTDEHFPQSGEAADLAKTRVINLRDLGYDLTMPQVEAMIRSRGYRAATLTELLLFANDDRITGGITVCALGSQWRRPKDGKLLAPGFFYGEIVGNHIPKGTRVRSLEFCGIEPDVGLSVGRGSSTGLRFLVVQK